MMNIGKAVAIFTQIDSEDFTDEQKAAAIYLVMNMPTHNSITKKHILKALIWLWHFTFEWEGETAAENENSLS